MTGLSGAQLDIARLLFGLPEARGFALAGGSALLALGAIDRPTHDIDAFVAAGPDTPPGDVGPLVIALRARLATEGWDVSVDRELVTFARLVARRDDDAVEVDLAVDSPPLFPIEHVHDLLVLAGQDLAARKILAILDRAAGRDFTDLRALSDRYSQEEILRWAQDLDSGVRTADVAHAFTKLERLGDADLPCSPESAPELRTWFRTWSVLLRAGGE